MKVRRISLASRVYCSLVGFLVCFLLQLGLISLRQYYVMTPQNRMISHIQDLSSFISLNEESIDAYSSFRWDYGDTEEFVSLERLRNIERSKYYFSLNVEYDKENEEEYLLSRSSINLYSTYLSMSEEIMTLLQQGERTKASGVPTFSGNPWKSWWKTGSVGKYIRLAMRARSNFRKPCRRL